MAKWRALLLIGAAGLALPSSGCFINQYPGDPNDRMNVLLVQSENFRTCRASGLGSGWWTSRLT